MTTPVEIAGKYRVLRLLGEGGMGQVFEAVNKNTERRVAIKTLHPRLAEDETVVQRFLREARAATLVRHPNVVDVLDLDVDPATRSPYLVQEFLVGTNLADALDARPERHFGVDEALTTIVPVMSALAAAHALGVVHRDLKPDNIFLVRDGRGAVTPKLIDFGIAKVLEGQGEGLRMTQTGAVMGTPGYMSPEQAGGAANIDARTDIWSIGVVLYELLVGRLPFEAPNYNVLVAKILFEEPTPILQVDPTLRGDVAAVVQRALTRDRDARFASMQEMLDATLACIADEGTRASLAAEPPPPPPPPPPSSPQAPWAPGAPTMPATPAPASPIVPTLASWTGSRSPPSRGSNKLWVAAAGAVAAAFVGGALWFARSAPPPPSSGAVLRAPAAHVAAPVPRVAAPGAPTTPSARTVVAPEAAPAAQPPTPAAQAPTPAAQTLAPPARTSRGHRRRPRNPASRGGQDFDRGYPQ